jgi:hypothetical protein
MYISSIYNVQVLDCGYYYYYYYYIVIINIINIIIIISSSSSSSSSSCCFCYCCRSMSKSVDGQIDLTNLTHAFCLFAKAVKIWHCIILKERPES